MGKIPASLGTSFSEAYVLRGELAGRFARRRAGVFLLLGGGNDGGCCSMVAVVCCGGGLGPFVWNYLGSRWETSRRSRLRAGKERSLAARAGDKRKMASAMD